MWGPGGLPLRVSAQGRGVPSADPHLLHQYRLLPLGRGRGLQLRERWELPRHAPGRHPAAHRQGARAGLRGATGRQHEPGREKIAYDLYVKHERIRISELATSYNRGYFPGETERKRLAAEKEEAELQWEAEKQQRIEAERAKAEAEQKVLSLARLLLQAGVPVAEIAAQTGLSEKVVGEL